MLPRWLAGVARHNFCSVELHLFCKPVVFLDEYASVVMLLGVCKYVRFSARRCPRRAAMVHPAAVQGNIETRRGVRVWQGLARR